MVEYRVDKFANIFWTNNVIKVGKNMDINNNFLYSQWKINKKVKQPLYIQLSSHIKTKIISGNLPDDYLFPPFRDMAKHFGVSRGIIAICFDLLISEGYILQNKSRRFFISKSNNDDIKSVDWQYFIKRATHTIDKLVMQQPKILYSTNENSKSYLIDSEEFGTRDIYVNAIKKAAERADLSYHLQSKGNPRLRECIANHLLKRDINVSPSQILITQSEHASMYLMFIALLSSSSTLITYSPNRFIMNSALELTRTRVAYVKTDDEGIVLDDLYSKIMNTYNPILYIEPDCTFPLGLSMSETRKHEIVDLCMRKGIPIVECDYQRDHSISPPPPIKSYDTANNILYQSNYGTFLNYADSIAFITGSEYIIEHLSYIYSQIAPHCTHLSQMVYLELLESGAYDNIIDELKPKLYQRLLDTDRLLNQYLSQYATWNKPAGGVFLLVNFKKSIKFAKIDANYGNCNWYYLSDMPNSILLIYPSCTLEELELFIKHLAYECEKQVR